MKIVKVAGGPRIVASEKRFEKGGTFVAISKAQKYLEKNGYSYGSMQREAPIAIAKGDVSISKWRDIGDDIGRIDGWILPEPDFREGGCLIQWFEPEVK